MEDSSFYLVAVFFVTAVLVFTIGIVILYFVAKQKGLLFPVSVVFERDEKGHITAIHYVPGARVGQ